MQDLDRAIPEAGSAQQLRIERSETAPRDPSRGLSIGPEADLEGADLTGALAQGAEARGAMLRRAKLTHVNFEGANLTNACLDEAVLDRANLNGANLTRASFRGASLTQATLTGATTTGTHFGGSDCTGAVLPAQLGNFESLLESAAKPLDSYRGLLLTVTGFVGYTVLTIMTTSDLQLVLNNAQVQLPLLSVGLPIRAFFVGAAVLALVLFLYLHVGLHHACRLLARLPATLPDGLSIVDKLDLGMTGLPLELLSSLPDRVDGPPEETAVRARDRWFKVLSRPLTIDFWRAVGFGAVAWLQLPALTVVLWGRSLANQRETDAHLLLALAIATCGCAVVFRQSTLTLFTRTNRSRSGPVTWLVLLCFGLGITWSLTQSALEGRTPMGVAIAENVDISRKDGGNWQGAYLYGASLKGARLRGSQLGHAHLEGAQLQRATLTQTSLEQALMQQSNLSSALLLGTNLAGTDLREATLSDARLKDADLTEARLEKATMLRASMVNAKLSHANLWRANLSGASLIDSHIEGAILTGADLENADFAGSDLTGADLSSAKLSYAGFEKANLHRAKLTGAVLTFARGLTPEVLCLTEGWRDALLPDERGEVGAAGVEITQPGTLRSRTEARCPKH